MSIRLGFKRFYSIKTICKLLFLELVYALPRLTIIYGSHIFNPVKSGLFVSLWFISYFLNVPDELEESAHQMINYFSFGGRFENINYGWSCRRGFRDT